MSETDNLQIELKPYSEQNQESSLNLTMMR